MVGIVVIKKNVSIKKSEKALMNKINNWIINQ